MFNLGKKKVTPQEELKDNAVNLVANVKNNVLEITDDIKRSANKVGDKFQHSTAETKQEVANLVNSLEALLAQYTSASKASEVKDQFVEKAVQLKDAMQNEVYHAYTVGKKRTVQTVQNQPILSIAVAAGAGLLIGYILGNKQSS